MSQKKSLPFEKLASELRAHGIDSQYMARVEARVTREQRLDTLQLEIAQEVAGALGRSDMRVNLALAELELRKAQYERAVLDGASLEERTARAEAFNQQRTVAQTRLRELLIHREAVGFRRNQVLNELYPIGPKLPLPET